MTEATKVYIVGISYEDDPGEILLVTTDKEEAIAAAIDICRDHDSYWWPVEVEVSESGTVTFRVSSLFPGHVSNVGRRIGSDVGVEELELGKNYYLKRGEK